MLGTLKELFAASTRFIDWLGSVGFVSKMYHFEVDQFHVIMKTSLPIQTGKFLHYGCFCTSGCFSHSESLAHSQVCLVWKKFNPRGPVSWGF